MFPLWFDFLGDTFVFLDVGPSISFFVFPLFFGALIYLWLAKFHQQIVFEKQLLKFKKILKGLNMFC
jgi:hypothetical protein